MPLSFSFTFSTVLLPLIFLVILGCTTLPSVESSKNVRCIKREALAILDFKKSFTSTYLGNDKIVSWKGPDEDCCEWPGITCNNDTGHVISLDISYEFVMSDQLRPSLLDLHHLERLDLSLNDFSMRIPDFIGEFSKLTYLNLSHAGFFGKVPPHLGNLSRLQTLVLSTQEGSLYCDDSRWISSLTSLDWLDVSYVNFSNAQDWVSTIGMLPLLSYFNCSSSSLPPSIGVINSSTSLEKIDLSHNTLFSSTNSWLVNSGRNLLELYLSHMTTTSPFPDDLFHNMVSLTTLDLSGNRLEQRTLEPIGNLCNLKVLFVSNCGINQSLTDIVMTMKGCARSSLETLHLGSNDLTGTFPSLSTEFPSLRQLYLSNNHLDSFSPQDLGHLPDQLQALDISFNNFTNLTYILHHLPSSLEGLYFSSNPFNDVISDTQVANLTKLKILDLSYNTNLTINFSKPPFQLQNIGLRSCRLGTSFPNWLLTQKHISSLDISNSNISGSIPAIFWNNLSSSLTYLNLSSNNLSDTVPDLHVLFVVSVTKIDLSSNAFFGTVPFFLFSSDELLLSHNHFTSFPPLPCSSNSSSFSCEGKSLSTFIDLSNNRLSGTFPECCIIQPYVLGFSVANNRLSGVIPTSIGDMPNTHIISLSNNNFFGEIPSSLKSCTKLGLLDLSGNNLTGNIPDWIGESLVHLIALSLRSNKFFGNMPSSMCLLSSLQILDLSHNNLSESIPSCVYNFTAMAQDVNYSYTQIALTLDAYPPMRSCTQALYSYALFNWKGKDRTFEKELPLLISMDLSHNNLSGEIPIELTSLVKLKSISLSSNNLRGNIPAKIGMLTSLESLNLEWNKLSGEIPSSLADITSLSKLDVSHNYFSGRIPIGTQLQSFGSSAYVGNLGLCGVPLQVTCPGDELAPQHSVTKANENRNIKWDMQSFYAASGTGFAFGLLALLGAVNFSRFANDCVNSIVAVVVSVIR